MAVGGCYSFLVLFLSYICGYSCGPERIVAAIVLTLGIVQCITGCSGCCWVTSSSSQVITNIKTTVRNFISREFVFFFYSLDNTMYVDFFCLGNIFHIFLLG